MRIAVWISCRLIRLYQLTLSPFIGRSCRFQPTCSEYTKKAIETYGFLKGFQLGCKRILKCHPWGGSGFDPVPEKEESTKNERK